MSKSLEREAIVDEIIASEQEYCEHLELIIHDILGKFRHKAEKNELSITDEKINIIFSNIEAIHGFHQMFYEELKTREIARAFLRFSDYLKLYTVYVNSYEDSADCITDLSTSRAFSKFVRGIRTSLRMDISSFLIMPVQRIPRYSILLSELRKHTEPDEPSLLDLEECIQKVVRIAHSVNEAKRRMESTLKLEKINDSLFSTPFTVISPHRVFIREDKLILFKSSFFRRRRLHRFMLFNDMLVWTGLSGKYKGFRNLNGLEVHTPATEAPEPSFQFENDDHDALQWICSTPDKRASWVISIKKARDVLAELETQRLEAMDERIKRSFYDPELESIMGEEEIKEKDVEQQLKQEVEEAEVGAFFDEELRIDAEEFDMRPFEPEDLRDIVLQAVKQQTLQDVEAGLGLLDEWGKDAEETGYVIPGEVDPLKPTFEKIKDALPNMMLRQESMSQHSREEYNTFLEKSIEDTADSITRMTTKLRSTVKKRKNFSSRGLKNPEYVQSISSKHKDDQAVIQEALLHLGSAEIHRHIAKTHTLDTLSDDVELVISNMKAREFWSTYFHGQTIVDFQHIKENYRPELSDADSTTLLQQFGHLPRYTEGDKNDPNKMYKPHKTYPIHVSEFSTLTEAFGFPFNISDADLRFKKEESLILQAKRKEVLALLERGTLAEIQTWTSKSQNMSRLKKRFDNGDTVFHILAKRGDPQIFNSIQAVCAQRRGMPTPDNLNHSQLLPVHYATFNGHKEVANILNGLTNPNVLLKHPVLHEAVRLSRYVPIDSILESKVDINATGPRGETVLSIAAANSNTKMAEFLLKRGAKPTKEEVKAAIDGDNAKLIRLLITAISNDDRGDIIRPECGDPILNIAASVGTSEVCEVLLEHGASINDEHPETRRTPFLAAAAAGNIGNSRCITGVSSDVVEDRDFRNRTALHLSCCDAGMTDHLIDMGVDINAQDDDGNTAVMLAALSDDLEAKEVLGRFAREMGLDFGLKNASKENVLGIVVKDNDIESCKTLIEFGADPAVGGGHKNNPMILAVRQGNRELRDFLINATKEGMATRPELTKSSGHRTALHFASLNKDCDSIDALLAAGHDPNDVDRDGNTPLHFSIRTHDIDSVKHLLSTGQPLDVQNDRGNTALLECFLRKDVKPEITQLVLNATIRQNVGLELYNPKGLAAVHLGIKNKNIAVQTLLRVANQSNLITRNSLESSTLTLACQGNWAEVIPNLIANGANLNHQDAKGNTGLMYACKKGSVKIAAYLIDAKSNLDLHDQHGVTALIAAAERKDTTQILTKITKIQSKSGKLDVCTMNGRTAAYSAAYSGNLEGLRILMDHGSDYWKASSSGWTPLHACSFAGNIECVRLLLDAQVDPNAESDQTHVGDWDAGPKRLLPATPTFHHPIKRGRSKTKHLDLLAPNRQLPKLPVPNKSLPKAPRPRRTKSMPRRPETLSMPRVPPPRKALPKQPYRRALSVPPHRQRRAHSAPRRPSPRKHLPKLPPLRYRVNDEIQFLMDGNPNWIDATVVATHVGKKYDVAVPGDDSGIEIKKIRQYQMRPKIEQRESKEMEKKKVSMDGITPLCTASRNDHLEVVELLLQYGAHIDPEDTTKWSALQISLVYSSSRVAEYLINQNADPMAENSDKSSAVLYMLSNGLYDSRYKHPVCVAMFEKHPNLIHGYERVPRWLAALGRLNIAKHFIELGGVLTEEHLKIAAERKQDEFVNLGVEKFNLELPEIEEYFEIQKMSKPTSKPPKLRF